MPTRRGPPARWQRQRPARGSAKKGMNGNGQQMFRFVSPTEAPKTGHALSPEETRNLLAEAHSRPIYMQANPCDPAQASLLKAMHEETERINYLEGKKRQESLYDSNAAQETAEEIRKATAAFHQKEAMLEREIRKHEERLAERQRAGERKKGAPDALSGANFTSQRAREIFFEIVATNQNFFDLKNRVAAELGRAAKKAVRFPATTLLLEYLNPPAPMTGPPQMKAAMGALNARKEREFAERAAAEYRKQGEFYERVLEEAKRLLPDSPATRKYEEEILKLRRMFGQ